MLPRNCELHSLDQIALLQRLSAQPSLEARDALFLATQLVNHGFSHAGAFVDRLRVTVTASAAAEYLARLARRHMAIQSISQLKDVQGDAEATRQLLGSSGFVFRPGSFQRHAAVVIFTTKFNNFGVSNVVADALFSQLGVSRLFLKDTSNLVYFRGVEGLSEDLSGLPPAVCRFLESQGIRQIVVTGFSSGGYASLFAATAERPAAYVGYSICSDLSLASKLPVPDFYARLRDQVTPDVMLDLRTRMPSGKSNTSWKLFFGRKDVVDREHAMHLIDCPDVSLTCHADAGHDITVRLIEDRTFLEPFQEILESLQ
jgi:hypothetical protein